MFSRKFTNKSPADIVTSSEDSKFDSLKELFAKYKIRYKFLHKNDHINRMITLTEWPY